MNKVFGFIKTILCKVKFFLEYNFYEIKSLYKSILYKSYKSVKLKKKYFKKVLRLDNLRDVISSIDKVGFRKDIANVTSDIDVEKLPTDSVHFYLKNCSSKKLPISIELYTNIDGYKDLEICILSKMKKVNLCNKWGFNCKVWIAVSSVWFISYNAESKTAENKRANFLLKPLLAFKR